MAKTIGLIHITTSIPPFNGVDCHKGILKKDFNQKAVPNQKQLIKLLTIFKNKDIWFIPEPKTEMIKNYQALKQIVKKIENNQKN